MRTWRQLPSAVVPLCTTWSSGLIRRSHAGGAGHGFVASSASGPLAVVVGTRGWQRRSPCKFLPVQPGSCMGWRVLAHVGGALRWGLYHEWYGSLSRQKRCSQFTASPTFTMSMGSGQVLLMDCCRTPDPRVVMLYACSIPSTPTLSKVEHPPCTRCSCHCSDLTVLSNWQACNLRSSRVKKISK